MPLKNISNRLLIPWWFDTHYHPLKQSMTKLFFNCQKIYICSSSWTHISFPLPPQIFYGFYMWKYFNDHPHFCVCVHIHFYLFTYLFIYLFVCWVFISVRGLSLVAASGGHSSSRCAGLSPSRPLLLRSTGSRHAGSVVVAHGLSCSAACGIFPDQGANPCPLHWQADSQPLRHQGSPTYTFLYVHTVK